MVSKATAALLIIYFIYLFLIYFPFETFLLLSIWAHWPHIMATSYQGIPSLKLHALIFNLSPIYFVFYLWLYFSPASDTKALLDVVDDTENFEENPYRREEGGASSHFFPGDGSNEAPRSQLPKGKSLCGATQANDLTNCDFHYWTWPIILGKLIEGANVHYDAEGKILCSYSKKQCSQRFHIKSSCKLSLSLPDDLFSGGWRGLASVWSTFSKIHRLLLHSAHLLANQLTNDVQIQFPIRMPILGTLTSFFDQIFSLSNSHFKYWKQLLLFS